MLTDADEKMQLKTIKIFLKLIMNKMYSQNS